MGKKFNLMSWLYCCGLALVVVGFFCPMFGKGNITQNGFKFINFENSSFVTIGALLIFAGAVAGILAQFVPQLKGLKLIFLLVSIVGGIVLVVGFMTGSGIKGAIYKTYGKQLLKHALIGFYLVIAGWVISCLGYFTSK